MGVIQIKRRSASGASGAPSSLKSGEVAFNEKDLTGFYGFGDDGSGNATSIIQIFGAGAFTDLGSAQTIGGQKTFSVTPIHPTPASGDSSTKSATTAFVQAIAALLAPLASPALTGTPTAPTPATSTNSTQIATTAFVLSLINQKVMGTFSFLGTIAASGALPTPSSNGFYIISQAGTFSNTSIALNVGDQIIYDQNANGDLATNWDYVHATANVASVFGRTGVVTAAAGDYTSAQITETSQLFFTTARVLATALAGLSTTNSSGITSSDTVLAALGKLQAQITAEVAAALHASNNLSDLASVSTARSNLGLGTMAVQNASGVAITGGTASGLTITNSSFDAGTY